MLSITRRVRLIYREPCIFRSHRVSKKLFPAEKKNPENRKMPAETTGTELTFPLLFPYVFLCVLWNMFFILILHETSLRIPIPQKDGKLGLSEPHTFFVHFSIHDPRRNTDGEYESVRDWFLDLWDGFKVKIEESFFMQFPFVYFNDTLSQSHKMSLSLESDMFESSWFQKVSFCLRIFTSLTAVLSFCFFICFWVNLNVEFLLSWFV